MGSEGQETTESVVDTLAGGTYMQRFGEAKAELLRRAAAAGAEAFILEGGVEGWAAAGLPVAVDRKAPLELMRQVQIAAGLLVLAGVILGSTVSPLFYGLSGFVGAGLTFAGVSGFCGMARMLALMPWNRTAAA